MYKTEKDEKKANMILKTNAYVQVDNRDHTRVEAKCSNRGVGT